jgi:hypothetical protein
MIFTKKEKKRTDSIKMNTCDTCEWWAKTYNTFGECGNPKLNARAVAFCKDADKTLASPARTALNERNDAIFRTGPKFGGIHHEPK